MDRGKAKTLAALVIAAMLPFPVTASSENRTTYEDEMLSPILAIGSSAPDSLFTLVMTRE
jgi:hypothetical protein